MRIGRWLAAGMLAMATVVAHARDIAGFHEAIHIRATDEVHSVACSFCTIEADAPIHGDIALAFSTIRFAPGFGVEGDVASAFSTMQFQGDSTIDGDVATFGGDMGSDGHLDVKGSQVSVSRPVAILIVLAPFALLAGLVYLIVALVRRRRMSYPPPGYYAR